MDSRYKPSRRRVYGGVRHDHSGELEHCHAAQAVEELLARDADVALLQEVGPGALEALKEAGGNVAVSPQDPWEPWPREHYDR